jgi:hypothetical protein
VLDQIERKEIKGRLISIPAIAEERMILSDASPVNTSGMIQTAMTTAPF